MEQKNLCKLTGLVGSVTRREISGKTVAFISMATHFTLKNATDEKFIETSWHDVKMWEGKNISKENLEALEKGTKVSLTGRVVCEKYTRANGEDCSRTLIVANSLVIEDNKNLASENKIELVGRVGSVKEFTIGGTNALRLTLATNHIYKNSADSTVVVETTWHNVNIFTGEKFPKEEMSRIKVGTGLSIVGRLQTQNYTSNNGERMTVVNVIPVEVEILEDGKDKK